MREIYIALSVVLSSPTQKAAKVDAAVMSNDDMLLAGMGRQTRQEEFCESDDAIS